MSSSRRRCRNFFPENFQQNREFSISWTHSLPEMSDERNVDSSGPSEGVQNLGIRGPRGGRKLGRMRILPALPALRKILPSPHYEHRRKRRFPLKIATWHPRSRVPRLIFSSPTSRGALLASWQPPAAARRCAHSHKIIFDAPPSTPSAPPPRSLPPACPFRFLF